MDYAAESLKMHYALKGKLEVTPRARVDSKDALSLAYTPGVAQPCLEIQKDINKSYPPVEHRGRGYGRHRRAGPGRHWPGGRYARDGGQVRAF